MKIKILLVLVLVLEKTWKTDYEDDEEDEDEIRPSVYQRFQPAKFLLANPAVFADFNAN